MSQHTALLPPALGCLCEMDAGWSAWHCGGSSGSTDPWSSWCRRTSLENQPLLSPQPSHHSKWTQFSGWRRYYCSLCQEAGAHPSWGWASFSFGTHTLLQLELRSADTPVTILKKVVGGLSLLRQHTIPSAQQASLMGGRHQDFKVFLIDITEEKWIGGVPCASVG